MSKNRSHRNNGRSKYKKYKNWEREVFNNRERSDIKEELDSVLDRRKSPPKKVVIDPRSINQENFIDALEDHECHIIAGVGPAGTGKTMLATLYAIKQLQEQTIKRIVITRPAVSVDEQHGFLPGTLDKKMEPWVLPILDVFKEYYNQREIQQMMNNGELEIAPLAYMRGRTFKDAVIIADEMQNATPNQVKMILTRIGENSKIVITGDLNQHDRGYEDNGLRDFIHKTERNDPWGIDVIRFSSQDIQRHPVIDQVLSMYRDDENER